ncbi:MAG: DUF3465 domain-containing protein [Gemmatimonadota bacterium]
MREKSKVVALALFVAIFVLSRPWSPAASPGIEGDGESRVAELFESRSSGEMVVVSGVVDAVLADDNEGSRHQRFIVRLESDQTLLVAHNIDLAERVPLAVDDPVTVHGQYEWNDRGGVLHWTHHDPDGRREGGWIDWEGRRYR